MKYGIMNHPAGRIAFIPDVMASGGFPRNALQPPSLFNCHDFPALIKIVPLFGYWALYTRQAGSGAQERQAVVVNHN